MDILGGAIRGIDQLIFVFVVIYGLIRDAGTKIAREASWSLE